MRRLLLALALVLWTVPAFADDNCIVNRPAKQTIDDIQKATDPAAAKSVVVNTRSLFSRGPRVSTLTKVLQTVANEPGEKGWTQTVDILMTTGEVVTLHTSLPDGRTVGLVELETINIYAGVIPGAWLSRYVALWGATHGELRHYQYEGTFANASSFDCDSGSPCPGVSQTSTFCTETVACGERAHTDSVVSAAITGPSSTLQPGKSVVADGLEYLLGEATVGLSKPCADERPTWVRAAILGSDP